jgi:hypothetical protein
MKGRLPTILSAAALLVVVASVTPIGHAARDAITPRARFALTPTASTEFTRRGCPRPGARSRWERTRSSHPSSPG